MADDNLNIREHIRLHDGLTDDSDIVSHIFDKLSCDGHGLDNNLLDRL